MGAPIDSWLTEPVTDGTEATRGYLICATPRSGSYFLCDLLRSTGVLGRPHEYFGAGAMRRHGDADYPAEIGAQLAIVRSRGCTSNGVFGAKVFPLQLADARSGAIFAGMGTRHLIHLERADVLGQAISLTRAAISNAYFAGQDGTVEPQFDAALIRDYLELIIRWNAAWHLWYARHGIVPLRLVYEDIVADPQSSVERVADALGIGTPARIDPTQLAMVIQRDALSAEWRQRFLAAQPNDRPLDVLRPASVVTFQRRTRRLLRMLRLRRD